MRKVRLRRVLGYVAAAALVSAPLVVASAALADPSTQSNVNVANGEELRQQWTIGNNTLITLTHDIDLGVGPADKNLCGDAEPLRTSTNLSKSIVVNGQGVYGITQTCKGERVLRDDADSETVTLQGLTHFTGGQGEGHGGGLRNDGPVNVLNSDVSGNVAYATGVCDFSASNAAGSSVGAQGACEDGDGGGVFAGGSALEAAVVFHFDITVTNSTVTGNEADDDGGGVYTEDTVTVIDSAFDGNIAHGNASGGGRGGGAFASDGASITGSTFSNNDAQCGIFEGDVCVAESDGGGFHTYGHAGVTGSDFVGNHAYDSGGGFYADESAMVGSSTFTGNNAGGESEADAAQVPGALSDHVRASDGATGSQNCHCTGGGFAVGGGIQVRSSEVADGGAVVTNSTFIANGAGCDQFCFGAGGGFFAVGSASVSGSTFGSTADPESGSNAAGCVFGCGAVGGGFYSGGQTSVETSLFVLNGVGCADSCGALGGGFFGGSDFTATSHAAGVRTMDIGDPGPLSVDTSTFRLNEAGCFGNCIGTGGAFYAASPTSVDVTASTFDSNDALWSGGAFSVNGGLKRAVCQAGCGIDITVVNSTITGNSSGVSAAVDASSPGDTLLLVNDTIDSNVILQHFFPDAAHASDARSARCECESASVIADTLVSFGTVITHPLFEQEEPGPFAAATVVNCFVFGGSTTQGYNYSDDTSCGFTGSTDSAHAGNNPLLGALASNGGPTPTMLPLTGSPLLDKIPPAAGKVTVDQRGVARPQGPGSDIGAVEVVVTPAAPSNEVVIAPKFAG